MNNIEDLRETEYANSVFEQPWWLNLVAKDRWKEVYVKKGNGEIIARFAYVTDKKRGKIPKLTQNIGIWFAEGIRNDYGAQKKAIFSLLSQLQDVKYYSFALSIENQYVLPFRWLGATIEPRFTYRIRELRDKEALFEKFSSEARRIIKKANNELNLVHDYDERHLWALYEKTFQQQNRKPPMSQNEILGIAKATIDNGHGRYVEAVDKDGVVHSCALFVFDQNVCYYLLGASDGEYRKSGSQYLVIWDGIQFAAQHSKCFDFEGSMVEGIEHFFRQFSGECLPYYVVTKNPIWRQMLEIVKPIIKRLLGYKI